MSRTLPLYISLQMKQRFGFDTLPDTVHTALPKDISIVMDGSVADKKV